jgi:hypothetical protein
MFLPYEVLREIIIRCDVSTIVGSFSVCREFNKLSQDMEYWAEKAEKENLCNMKIFNEFLTYEETTNLIELTNEVVRSDNIKLIKLFDKIRKRFSTMDITQVQKYVKLLTTSVVNLYTFFYKFKHCTNRCSYIFRRGELKGKKCENKSLGLCKYCANCLRREKNKYGDLLINVEGPIIVKRSIIVKRPIIVMEVTNEDKIIRDFLTNFVFYHKYGTCTLLGKLNKGVIEPVSEEDKILARAIYI